MKWWMQAMTLSLGLGACQPASNEHASVEAKGPKPVPRYEAVTAAQVLKVTTLPAEITLPAEAVLGLSLPTQATITAWNIKVGDWVEAGAPLAMVQLPEMADLEASQREAARVVKARQQALAQERKALAAGLSQSSAVQALEVALTEAKARQEAVGRSLAARSNLSRSEDGQSWVWRSPMTGRVEQLSCAVGTPTVEGERCVQLLNEQQVVVRTHVPEQVLDLMKGEGLQAELVLAGQTQRWPLELWRRAPRLDPRSRTLAFEFQSKDGALPEVGRSGRVDIFVAAPSGSVVVPEVSLTRLEGQDVVFVKETGPTQVVRLGRAQEGVVVKADGLSVGLEVATEELFGLKSLHVLGEGGDE